MNKKILLHTLLTAFLVVFFLGCSESTIEGDRIGTLQGTVVSRTTGEAVDSVKITTSPASTTVFTNENGMFTIETILVDDYSVQAEKTGFGIGFEPVEILENQVSDVAIELRLSDTENDSPAAPILVTPEDGAIDIESEVELVWIGSDPEDDELTYTVELRNGSTDEIREFEVVADTMLTVSNLRLSTSYFWEVTADDDVNDPVSSEISSFTTTDTPNNPVVFVKKIEENNVIFSGQISEDNSMEDVNVFQLTSENKNSFRPLRNTEARKIAFLRSDGAETHLFTMDYSGNNVFQVTTGTAVAGFRQGEVKFSWSAEGDVLYYPNFNSLYRINVDGTGNTNVFTTLDGSFISEVVIPDFDQNTAIIKTNDLMGYNATILRVNLNTGAVIDTILSNAVGAVGSLDVTANGNIILYSRDVLEDENDNYRIFRSRLFLFNVGTGMTTQVDTETSNGFNEIYGSYIPNEAGYLTTRVSNEIGATPDIFISRDFGGDIEAVRVFTGAFQADWE